MLNQDPMQCMLGAILTSKYVVLFKTRYLIKNENKFSLHAVEIRGLEL